MSKSSVVEFLTAAKQNESLREKLKTAMDVEACVDIAEDIGYDFSTEELQMELSNMPEEEVAVIINPGISPRRHIQPR
ncbi:MAG: Nif11-like leader peptide family natural product precursor [Scytonematopsis contorta HA4267-MV1]|jgi:predicted ribosomally synthesized peptide with nif11-like leader|nr:Nif11-like leader peptide family natural product precursor [Scytonematopsis contorta HA4267-MV1]